MTNKSKLKIARDGPPKETINKYRKMWIKHNNPNDSYTIPKDKLPDVQRIVLYEQWPTT